MKLLYLNIGLHISIKNIMESQRELKVRFVTWHMYDIKIRLVTLGHTSISPQKLNEALKHWKLQTRRQLFQKKEGNYVQISMHTIE